MYVVKSSRLAAVWVAAAFVCGCKKDNGGSLAGNFSPLTANSSWTYQNTPGGMVTITATNRDTTALGRTYRVLTNSAGGNVYLAKDGSNYYRFGSVAELNIPAVEELYLKAAEPVNAVWTATQNFTVPGAPFPVTANLGYTVKSKGQTRTVGSNTFNNVTHVRLDITVALLGNIGGGDFYYADGVGMVENVISVTVPGQAAINQSQVLTAYTIR